MRKIKAFIILEEHVWSVAGLCLILNNQGLEDIWLFHFGSFLSGDSKMTALFTEEGGM